MLDVHGKMVVVSITCNGEKPHWHLNTALSLLLNYMALGAALNRVRFSYWNLFSTFKVELLNYVYILLWTS